MDQEIDDNLEADNCQEYTISMNSCRICLKPSNQPMCLLFERVKSISYADMLRCVTRIKATADQELPDKICCKCRATLEKAFIFKAVAEKSDARLKLLKQIDYDFSAPSVKIEYFENEEYDDVAYSEDHEDLKEGDETGSAHVKREGSIEYGDEIIEDNVGEYLEDVTENEELAYEDCDLYNSEGVANELELDTTALDGNEIYTGLDENIPCENKNYEKVVKRKDKRSPRVKSKSRQRRKRPSSESKDREKHICPICGLLVVHLTQHMNSHNERIIQCPQCPKTFHKLRNLNTHLKYHSGTKNYVCSVCGRAFYHSRELNRHSSVHTGVKPYSCELCNKTFVAGNTLKLHMEIHAGTKRYKCDVCGTSFRAPHQLKAHSIIHTGDKPYHCQICDIGFSYKVKLNDHVQKVHGINLKFKSVHTFTYEQLLEEKAELENNPVHFIEYVNEIDGNVDQIILEQEEIDQTVIAQELDQTVIIQEELDQTVMKQEEIDQPVMTQEEIDQTMTDYEFINQEELTNVLIIGN